ncbi:uncharacterized protein LOC114651583 [Erpetoichthys calabaricus]|uniref:uncharacterized protein LOC114651583 n=1 Tax=Erpetoichthys calabaricus TaxID=27687 RepID=UPI00109F27D4|nr:uncharacterized protein LOC114651583 [Erpetoichthys calabaricus]XP_051783538.1 uncharacterized protein LOC114651583 [Erpetoichthys calabaricus]
MAKERATFFNVAEQELLMQCYEDERFTIAAKSNTAASAKEKEEAWKRIADRINACNTRGVKRSWQQVKTKYKNILQRANKKMMEKWKVGGDAVPPRLTVAEELVLIQNQGWHVMEEISGGSSSEQVGPIIRSPFVKAPSLSIALVDPLLAVECLEEHSSDTDDDDEDASTMSSLRIEGEKWSKSPGDGCIQKTYKRYLEEETEYRRLKKRLLEKQTRKLDLEIQLLEKQLVLQGTLPEMQWLDIKQEPSESPLRLSEMGSSEGEPMFEDSAYHTGKDEEDDANLDSDPTVEDCEEQKFVEVKEEVLEQSPVSIKEEVLSESPAHSFTEEPCLHDPVIKLEDCELLQEYTTGHILQEENIEEDYFPVLNETTNIRCTEKRCCFTIMHKSMDQGNMNTEEDCISTEIRRENQ